jgi:uncharacterized protein (UPF0332 family)
VSEIASLLARARKYLGSAELLIGAGDFESAVSRAYYAMFYATEALLLSRGLAFSSHKAVLSALGEHFIRADLLPKDFGRALNRAFAKRQLGDYEYTFVVSEGDARETLADARSFVAAAAALLARSGFPE